MAGNNKEVLINLRLKPETREEFRIAAELRGATMSGLLHQFIVRTIREEKDREPKAFKILETAKIPEPLQPSETPASSFPGTRQRELYKEFLEKSNNMNEKEDASLLEEHVHARVIKKGSNQSGDNARKK